MYDIQGQGNINWCLPCYMRTGKLVEITDSSFFVRENTYVRVVGSLVRLSGHNYLKIIKIRKAVDYHEFCFHLLEVMVTTLTYERGPPVRDSPNFISYSDM